MTTETSQVKLLEYIDQRCFDEFSSLYRNSLSLLKSFEHVELLLRCCRFGLLDFVREILNQKAIDVNCSHSSTGYSPLFIAIRCQHQTLIEYIIEETKVNLQWICDKKDVTYLDEAIRQWDVFAVRLLLQRDARIDQRHFFLTIIQCFREKNQKTFPMEIFDALMAHQPTLIDGIEREQMQEFFHRRCCVLSSKERTAFPALFERFSHYFTGFSLQEMPQTSNERYQTHVAIIGCGPAGLMLSCLLSQLGIQSIILEQQSRSTVESNIRAGVLEQSTMDLLDDVDGSERLFGQAILNRHLCFQFNNQRFSLPLTDFTEGHVSTFYGQHRFVQDLLQVHSTQNSLLFFDIEHTQIERHDFTMNSDQRPLIRFRRSHANKEEEIECDFIAGCDGARSSCCRASIPKNVLTTRERSYPYCWLSILVDAPPTTPELVYSFHDQYGFAVHSLRSLTQSRLHLQVSVHDTLNDWPDEKIWTELEKRLTPADQSWKIQRGPILQRAIFPLRNIIHTPMQYQRLFLAGDAAHIVPPTGAKGLNLAVRDAHVLSQALSHYYDHNDMVKLNEYTTTCLSYLLEAHEFADYMTSLLHKLDISDDKNQTDPFDLLMQQARQCTFQHSKTLQRHIAQLYAH